MLQALLNHSEVKGQHTLEVITLTETLVQVLDITPEDKELILVTANVHAVGFLTFLPSLCDYKGKYSEEQFQLVKTYPEKGADLLKAKGFSADVVKAVRYHAHNYDESLPLAAKVVRFTRDFRRVLEQKDRFPTMKDALQDMQNMSGKAYDPAICKAAWIAFNS